MAREGAGSSPDEADLPVGAVLGRLRRRAGVTGQRLAERLNMSQAKISKIETGATSPSPQDVERIARALGAPPAEVKRLRDRADHDRNQMVDWRVGRRDPASWQRELVSLEAQATELRVFSPAVISGLLQTSEFARSILTQALGVWSLPPPGQASSVGEAVSGRMQRQEILDDPAKRFHFVMPEIVLRNVLTQAEDMPAQVARLLAVSRQENVSISVILETSPWVHPPLHGFSLLDDRHVVIDLFNTVVVTRGAADLRAYRQIFDALEAQATRDVEPIFDKYRRLYLRRAHEA